MKQYRHYHEHERPNYPTDYEVFELHHIIAHAKRTGYMHPLKLAGLEMKLEKLKEAQRFSDEWAIENSFIRHGKKLAKRQNRGIIA